MAPPLPSWHQTPESTLDFPRPDLNRGLLRWIGRLFIILLVECGFFFALTRLKPAPIPPPAAPAGKHLPSLSELVLSSPDSSKSAAQFVLNEYAAVNDTRRKADLAHLGSALAIYAMESEGNYQFKVTQKPQDIGTSGLNLKRSLTPQLLESIPHDPLPQYNDVVTGYTLHLNESGRFVLTARSQLKPDEPIITVRLPDSFTGTVPGLGTQSNR